MGVELGLPARWISPIYGECLTAHAAAAYLHQRGCACHVEGPFLIVSAEDEARLEPVDTPIGRMFPVGRLDAILETTVPLSFDAKADYNPD